MRLRRAFLRSTLCAAALMVTLGLAAGRASAAANASPPSARPRSTGQGLILTMPATPPADALTRARAACLENPDDLDTDELDAPRAFLKLDPDSARFAPMAGIVYAF